MAAQKPAQRRDSTSMADLYAHCVAMVNDNKVSTKNCFDLNLIEHIDDIVGGFMGGKKRRRESSEKQTAGEVAQSAPRESLVYQETRFHEASCTIEASAKIYACRVDSVHSDTYRILGGLANADEDENRVGEDGKPLNKKRRVVGVNTLERNEANIIQSSMETDEQSDPMFRRMAASFDAGGAKGLMMGKLHLAEDLSLVFNGDVPVSRANAVAQEVFRASGLQLPVDGLACGDPEAFCSTLQGARLCQEVDQFRSDLWGASGATFQLPDSIDKLIAPGAVRPAAAPKPAAVPIMDRFDDVDDLPELQDDVPEILPEFLPDGRTADASAMNMSCALVPFTNGDCASTGVRPGNNPDDAIAFDELYEKFCGKSQDQFAYFEDLWAKPRTSKDQGALQGALQDVDQNGQVVTREEAKEAQRAAKRPLFDFADLGKPVKPIETEPAYKHQINEKHMLRQLHQDVPPYMVDRITMPTWQAWSRCDFAALGLRPHLMLKLQRREPEGEGPHTFSELYSTAVVENPDAYPWLRSGRKDLGSAGAEDDDEGGLDREIDLQDDAGNDYENEGGLPSHLDVNPSELFVQPDDRVVGGDDLGFPTTYGEDLGDDYVPNLDLDMVALPKKDEGVGYSRNAKFVDVKLVKKHLWKCIEEDITEAKSNNTEMAASFQDLVDRTMKKMPASECDNLSVQVCFICALHLCNEKNLEIEAGGHLGDFEMVAPCP